MRKAPRSYYIHNTRSIFMVTAITIAVSFIVAVSFETTVDFLSYNFGMVYPVLLFLGLILSIAFGEKKKVRWFNMMMSIFGAIFSILATVLLYFKGAEMPLDIFFFAVSQILVVLFLFASYFSIQAFKK